jgi:hypothetical protein
MLRVISSSIAATSLAITKGAEAPEPLWMKLLPIVISVLALLVSCGSFIVPAYHQYFRRAKLRCLLSQNAKCFSSPDGHLAFIAGFTIFNEGAQYGSVYRIIAELRHADEAFHARLHWKMFVEPKNAGTTGQKFLPHDEFAGWTDTIVIPNRAAVYKRISFRSQEPFDLKAGRYEVIFEIFQGVEKTPDYKSGASFVISDKLARAFLETKSDPETHVALSSITFPITAHD